MIAAAKPGLNRWMWLVAALLLLAEFTLFDRMTSVHHASIYPRWNDQIQYLRESYTAFEEAKAHGLAAGLKIRPRQPALQGTLHDTTALVVFWLAGSASRSAALSLNMLLFLAWQASLLVVSPRISGSRALGWMGLGRAVRGLAVVRGGGLGGGFPPRPRGDVPDGTGIHAGPADRRIPFHALVARPRLRDRPAVAGTIPDRRVFRGDLCRLGRLDSLRRASVAPAAAQPVLGRPRGGGHRTARFLDQSHGHLQLLLGGPYHRRRGRGPVAGHGSLASRPVCLRKSRRDAPRRLGSAGTGPWRASPAPCCCFSCFRRKSPPRREP